MRTMTTNRSVLQSVYVLIKAFFTGSLLLVVLSHIWLGAIFHGGFRLHRGIWILVDLRSMVLVVHGTTVEYG